MPAKHLSSESTPIGGMYIKLNLRKKTGCCAVLTIPTISKITNHLDVLRRSLGLYSTKYDNLMVIGDLNVEVNQECMKFFCETYDLSSLIKVPTFYKNLSWIDLILTNQPKSFQNSSVGETGLFDFHKMTVTVTKTSFEKYKPRISYFRNWNKFYNKNIWNTTVNSIVIGKPQ